MALWLMKTEPDDYSYDDLVRDKACVWDGVGNNQALQFIREIKKGDQVFVYHTGDTKAVIGIATVTKSAYADPKLDDPKMAVVDLKPTKKLKRPVMLKEIKADPAFAGWQLVSNSRLSAMPVPQAIWNRIEHLSTTDVESSK